MGLIDRGMGLLFGSGNVIAETAEVFRENAEASAQRAADLGAASLAQFAAEFAAPRQGAFDRFMDGVNRLPRPVFALGTVGLFGAAMVDPLWFAERMVGLSVVPDPLWWLLGAVVSFYFGARHQAKGQAFQRDIAAALARTPGAVDAIARLREARQAQAGQTGEDRTDAAGQDTAAPSGALAGAPRGTTAAATPPPDGNAALDDWRAGRG
ncbi:holin family protein [Oceaniglobus roseus]|uniref:holin family protein n=1 Tax=Oceaniglobus roseus TaxID=1737570 RepID=UPI000C7EBC5D|nr:holin family protein [Kandeliimicrobium roseum]